MTSFSNDRGTALALPRLTAGHWILIAGLSLLLIPLLYLFTLAHTLVLGDPTEYTFVANILGIAHPPGYAFITVVGHLFQRLIPFGTIPWRMHLLAATAGTTAAVCVYGTVRASGGLLAALFAALTVATAVNFWQHAIHANPHILTAAFLAANLFFLSRWWAASSRDKATTSAKEPHAGVRWLYAFALSAGLGITHHPLTVFAFPAYGLFILAQRPAILREGRTLLKMVGFGLLGLSVWLYFPLRSPMEPLFGPHDMNTLEGFLNVTLARGLRVNLFHFGPADQLDRALVFWTLLRLQYSLPLIALALIGVGWLARDVRRRPLLLLYGLAFLILTLFVINTVQDVMAYLLGPFLIVGLLAGIGFDGLLRLSRERLGLEPRPLQLLGIALFLLGPILQTARNLPQISLRDYSEGDAYVSAVFDYFAGDGEGAVLLHDWEHMTPMWYSRFVAGRWPDPADVRPEFVSSAHPWLPSVYDYLGGGPVYLSNYRREIVDAGFRLRPRGPFYQVVEPGDETLPPELTPVGEPAGALHVEGYRLPETLVQAGDYVPLVLALSAPSGSDGAYYTPVIYVGELRYEFTTDSHLITPLWEPDEIIVERYDFALPHDLPAGNYPVRLRLHNLSQNQDSGLDLSLGTLQVSEQSFPVPTNHLLANFRQRVGLVSATAAVAGQRRSAPWDTALVGKPGEVIHLTLQWESLARAEESYTVFVHLIDGANQLVAPPLDYTPLGGAAPTHLWIPKWLPGQRLLDPYRLPLPADLAPGTYLLEVGLYEMTSGRRLHIADAQGNLIGDRYILGAINVQP